MTSKLSRAGAFMLLVLPLLPLTGCKAKLQAQLRDREETIRSLDGQLSRLRMENEQLKRERNDAIGKATDLEGRLADATVRKPAESELDKIKADLGSSSKDLNIRYIGNRLSIGVPNKVSFAPGSSTISSEGKRLLNEVSRVLSARFHGHRIYIEGHTDSTPVKKSRKKCRNNRHLSAMRAEAVAGYLSSRGVADSKIVILGYGPHEPVSRGNLSANRRVEIVVGD